MWFEEVRWWKKGILLTYERAGKKVVFSDLKKARLWNAYKSKKKELMMMISKTKEKADEGWG